MKLFIQERIVLGGLLPEQGNYVNLKLIREAKESLSFTEEEHSLYSFKQMGENSIQWDATKDKGTDFKLGAVVEKIIKEKLMELDEKEELDEKHYTLYEKFCL